MDLVLKTFDQWNAEGYRIIKGSKAYSYTDRGDALFSEDQVYAASYNVGFCVDNMDEADHQWDRDFAEAMELDWYGS